MAASGNSRETAARIVFRWLETGEFPDRLLEQVTLHRAIVQEMVLGSVRWRRALDFVLQKIASREPRPALKACAYVGLYQLFHMDRTEAFAAVHETVEVAKKLAGPSTAGFINALLRRAQREQAALTDALAAQPPAVRWSHPDLLWTRWAGRFGEERAGALCRWNNERAETWIRRRPGDGFEKVERGQAVHQIEGYSSGDFVVQDPATNLSVSLLNPQPGERVLDACASPGGKTVAIADRMQGQGELHAWDLHDDRIALLRENLARARCDGVRVAKSDAASGAPAEPFDRVLLDAPCSNTGVIRRRPDARWRFATDRLMRVVELQTRLLDSLARLVKPGGTLVYSTCSLEQEENEGQVSSFLQRHPNFRAGGTRFSFPPETGFDGAFSAELISSSSSPV